MFDLIDGLPVHALVVHAVVVLLPLAVLGTIAIALVPRWRMRYGPIVIALAGVATALVPVATSSGEALEERVGDPGEHAELGDQLIWFAIPLLLVVIALVWFQRRSERAPTHAGPGKNVLRAVAAIALIVALANVVQVYRIGDSGARAVWDDEVSSGNSD